MVADDPLKPPFMEDHTELDVPRLKGWKCIPMSELNKRGPEVAALEGKVLVGAAKSTEGESGLAAPQTPPGFRRLPPPPGKRCSERLPCEDMPDVRLLRDRRGELYWVTLRPPGDPRSRSQPGDLPEEVPTDNSAKRDPHAAEDFQMLAGHHDHSDDVTTAELRAEGFEAPEDPDVDLHHSHGNHGSEDLYQPSLMEQLDGGTSLACASTNMRKRKFPKHRAADQFFVLPTLDSFRA